MPVSIPTPTPDATTLAAAGGLFTTIVGGVAAFLSGRRTARATELQTLLDGNASLRDELRLEVQRMDGRVEKLEETIKRKDAQIEIQQTEIEDLKRERRRDKARIEELEEENAALRTRVRKQGEEIALLREEMDQFRKDRERGTP